ncbi:Glutamine--fructose-6-phosphate aminotransferase [isomerizing] [Baekduia alba]|uniref:SIS domain-containing protein n=1 Tax=Baekduia alba TaxID=2997333 RepID=UPI0023426489|nr:SIS domain-containing protein [Baekduia alba]WCB96477.1 Glutamine--fructose-6-phosphate aminotransferase [isomerizing] [Baekduia alba]
MSAAGVLREEVFEQPAAWRALLERAGDVAEVARALAASPPALVRIAAHGTSDHAAIFAGYLLRARLGWTVVRDSMSLPLYYGVAAAAPGELAIGISQSGATPDVATWLERARGAGATTLAITNGGPEAPLVAAADHVLHLGVGRELSIAATKTYTGTLATLALLCGHLAGREAGTAAEQAVAQVADAGEAALPGIEGDVAPVAEALAAIDRMYLVARGVELATVNEIALKLTEVAYLGAKAMSATAMAHGPVAALDAGVPLYAIASPDATLPAVVEAVARAHDAGAPVLAAGPAAAALEGAAFTLPTPPAARDPLLTPMLSVLPGQLLAWSLALAKGIDPGAPRHLRKVTSAA